MLKSISTFGLLTQRSANLRALESDLANTTHELSTGKKSDIASQLREETPVLIALRAKYEENTAFLQSVNTFERRAEIMSAAFSNVNSALNMIVENTVVNVPDAGDSIATLSLSARSALEQIVDALNANFDGRFLFSGIDIDLAPFHRATEASATSGLTPDQVAAGLLAGTAYAPAQPPAFGAYTALEAADAIARFDAAFDGTNAALPAPTDDYSFERSFYNGALAGPLPSVRLSDGAPLSYGATGDDPALRSAFQGLYMLASVDLPAMAGTEAYEPYVTEALNRLTVGQDALRAVHASLGAAQNAVADSKSALQSQNLILNNQIIAYEEADPIETQSRFAEIEKQLDAAYAATVRVSRLRLTNYL
jgi:flagellar hook-associated protein 3 FlgL